MPPPADPPLPVPLVPSNVTKENGTHPYHEYSADTGYLEDEGLLAVPLSQPAQDGSTVRYVKVSSQRMEKHVNWQVSRLNQKPQLPSPDPADANEILLRKFIIPSVPQQQADGVSRLYVVRGTYVFGLKKPVEEYAMGTAAMDSTAKTQGVLKDSDFQRSIY